MWLTGIANCFLAALAVSVVCDSLQYTVPPIRRPSLAKPQHSSDALLTARVRRMDTTSTMLHSSSDTTITEGSADTSDNDNDQKPQLTFLGQEEDQELLERGEWEASLMHNQATTSPLRATKLKGVGGSGGFGKASSTNFKQQAKQYANVLQKEGIVRIDNVLSSSLADALKDYVVDLRARATLEVKDGTLQLQDRFADVLHNQNRCDLKVPLGPKPVMEAMHHVLSKTALRNLIQSMFSVDSDGSDAVLFELNCFMSNSGSRRQLVHPDNACETGLPTEAEPVMLTCFIALSDIDMTMGPTCFIPRTHNTKSHNAFFSDKASVLGTHKNVMGVLPKGACAIFDPRVLHCATANKSLDPNLTRALFYFSFKNPRVIDPGSPSCGGYGIKEAELTIEELSDELAAWVVDDKNGNKKTGATSTERLDKLAAYP